MSRYEIRALGILLLVMPITIVVSWTGLMINFEYPDILREPVEVILHKYREGGAALKAYWAGMVASSLLIIPIVMLLYRLTSRANRSLSLAAAGIGLASAIFHVVGFSRWLFAVDYLGDQYAGADQARKETIAFIFNVLHQYFGVTVGETLGFATMGVWGVLTAVALYQAGYMRRWLAVVSIGSGIGIIAGTLEWAGWPVAVEINAYAYQLWILIVAGLGISLLWRARAYVTNNKEATEVTS